MNDQDPKPHTKAFSHRRGTTGRLLTFEEYLQKYPEPQVFENLDPTGKTLSGFKTFAQFMQIARDANAQSKETDDDNQPDEDATTETTSHTGSQ
jgi:hypothetical protein